MSHAANTHCFPLLLGILPLPSLTGGLCVRLLGTALSFLPLGLGIYECLMSAVRSVILPFPLA